MQIPSAENPRSKRWIKYHHSKAMEFPLPYGKYILLEHLAMGGMGEIFRGKTVGIGGFEKEVAIKRLLPDFCDDEDVVNMFIDEARIAAKLQHANIAQILDFDKVDETYFITMEYVDGRDLKHILERGQELDLRLSIPQVLHIVIEVAKALQFAHSKTHKGLPLNIVHRDVSPHNIMVTFSGEVKLMDFGIVKADRRVAQTKVGVFKGKMAYMAPEQLRSGSIDKRVDIFGLGTVLWESLVGEQLFQGETEIETLSRTLTKTIPRPRELRSAIHPELDRIVMRALEREPSDRYQDCGELLKDLRAFFYGHVDDPSAINLAEVVLALFAEERQSELGRRSEEKTVITGADEALDDLYAGNAPTLLNPMPQFDDLDEEEETDGDPPNGDFLEPETTAPIVDPPAGLERRVPDTVSDVYDVRVDYPNAGDIRETGEELEPSSPFELNEQIDEVGPGSLDVPNTILTNTAAMMDDDELESEEERAMTVPLDYRSALAKVVVNSEPRRDLTPQAHSLPMTPPREESDDESWMPSRLLAMIVACCLAFLLAAFVFLWIVLTS